jgi:hypothetical protein
MKNTKLFITAMAALMGASWHRIRQICGARPAFGEPGHRYALPNAGLGLINEHGIESLLIDPGTTFPVTSRYLLYERGSALQYCELAAGTKVPLGPSSDSPYQAGDAVSVRRLGCKPGLELGIPGSAITIDDLVCCATDGTGHIVDLATLCNGTYWVVGRAAQTCLATDVECAYVPCYPYKIQVSNGGGTYAFAGAGA